MAPQEDLERFSQQIPCQSPVHPAELSSDDKFQGVERYNELSRKWRDIVHKKSSYGPAVGASSARSLPLFDMCSYDTDFFEKSVTSDNFRKLFRLDDATRKEIDCKPAINECVENHKERMTECEQEVLDEKIHQINNDFDAE